MKAKVLKIAFLSAMAFITVFLPLSATNVEANGCNFYRDISIGSRGEDVRCLQQYLRDSGYSIGFGIPDGVFGPITRQAVVSWQRNSGLPVSGVFEANSRARYFEIFGGEVLGASDSVNINTNNTSFFGTNSSGESREIRAMSKIREALIMIDDAEEEIDDSNRNTSSAKRSLKEANEDILDAVHAYFVKRNYSEAFDLADEALENAEDAFEDAGGDNDNDRNSADEAIDDARDAIEDARDEIEEADDDGENVDEAEELLEDAQDRLDEAEDQFDDRDYDDAEKLAEEAEELADDAVDAID